MSDVASAMCAVDFYRFLSCFCSCWRRVKDNLLSLIIFHFQDLGKGNDIQASQKGKSKHGGGMRNAKIGNVAGNSLPH